MSEEAEMIYPAQPGRVPTCPENHRQSIDDFLAHFYARIERTLGHHREVLKDNRTTEVINQIEYFRHQLSTIKWLRAMNEQRRKHARNPAAR